MRKGCVHQYFSDRDKTRFNKSFVTIAPTNEDAPDGTYFIFFPRPFQLTGTGIGSDLPLNPDDPGVWAWQGTKFVLDTPDVQAANSRWLQSLFISLANANLQEAGTSNGLTTFIEDRFSEYFYQYLGDSIRPAYINEFVSPGNEMIDFWDNEAAYLAAATPDNAQLLWNERFQNFQKYLAEVSSKHLYGCPGLYVISDDTHTVVGEHEPYTPGFSTFIQARHGFAEIATSEIDCPFFARLSSSPDINNGSLHNGPPR